MKNKSIILTAYLLLTSSCQQYPVYSQDYESCGIMISADIYKDKIIVISTDSSKSVSTKQVLYGCSLISENSGVIACHGYTVNLTVYPCS